MHSKIFTVKICTVDDVASEQEDRNDSNLDCNSFIHSPTKNTEHVDF